MLLATIAGVRRSSAEGIFNEERGIRVSSVLQSGHRFESCLAKKVEIQLAQLCLIIGAKDSAGWECC